MSAAGLKQLRHVLSLPRVAWLVGGVLLAGPMLGVLPVAGVIYFADRAGSYSVAGFVLAAFAIGRIVATSWQGRMLDRVGTARPLGYFAGVHLAAMTTLLAAAELRLPAPVLLGAAAVAGAAYPSLPTVLRTLWPVLVRTEELRRPAFLVDALLAEAVFIGAGAVSGLLLLVLAPIGVLALCALAVVPGTLAFIRAAPPLVAETGDVDRTSKAGPRVLVFAVGALAVVYGASDVIIPAFIDRHGLPASAAALVALPTIGSIAAALVVSVVLARISPVWTLFGGLVCAALTFAWLTAADSVALLIAAAIAIGLPFAPANAAVSELMWRWTGGRVTSYSWLTTAVLLGAAAGSAATGVLLDEFGSGSPMILGLVVLTAAAGVLTMTRRTA